MHTQCTRCPTALTARTAGTLAALVAASLLSTLWLRPVHAQALAEPMTGGHRAVDKVSAFTVPRKTMPASNLTAVSRDTEVVTLALGEIKMLPIVGKVRRIAVGNGNYVSATTVDTHLMLIAEQVGATMLMVWSEGNVYSFQVRVMPSDFVATRRIVESVLKGAPGVSVEEVESKLVISGTAHRAVLDRLTATVKDVPGVVLNVRADEGSPLVRSVLFRLHFVEVNKSLLEKIGVQWARDANGPTFAGQTIPLRDGIYRNIPPAKTGDNLLAPVPSFVSQGGRTGGVFFGLATSIASRINLGVSEGDARILASPELTAKSGGKARLQVGGEVPIPLAGAFGTQTVEFKPYGIIFSIEPVVDGDDIITAKLSTELSQIDPAVTIGGIPGFLTRSTSTEISVKPGEMIALSGLVNSELSNAVDKVPGIGNIPILGRLFRSDDFRNRKTDLVVLLEPEIITPGHGMAEQLRQRGTQNTLDFENKVEVKGIAPATPLAPTSIDSPAR